ncbi:MAG TPA: hypothetical protein VGO68_18845 [Pyrinomonadaceae bacterium]|jgi:hypothetical protein|nr:hypothetical protein [Pyrinomonadaceae bacterium]
MAGESKINIWLLDAGLSLYGLAQLYSQSEIGAGYRRARLYGDYELGRLKDESR